MIKTLKDLQTATNAEMVALYNKHASSPIKKFRDRATGIARCTPLVLQEAEVASSSKKAPQAATAAAEKLAPPQREHIIFLRDHSGSMSSYRQSAMVDYNSILTTVQDAAVRENIDCEMSVITFGSIAKVEERRVKINEAEPLRRYQSPGNATAMYRAIELALAQTAAGQRSDESTLVYITTDGVDNVSREAHRMLIIEKMKWAELHHRTSFVFRVPKGAAQLLRNQGIPEGNIMEWELSSKGLETASAFTASAVNSYFATRSAGATTTKTFFADTTKVTAADIATLKDISSSVNLWPVSNSESGMQIRDFVEQRLRAFKAGAVMLKGAAFYQLMKTEDKVHAQKLIVIRDKDTGEVYHGQGARALVGLPIGQDARVKVGAANKYQIFVQSTSVNRKLVPQTQVLYWSDVGQHYKEGRSAK